jgi:hypothetical protein
MSFSYYIKNRDIDYPTYSYIDEDKQKEIKELLDNIYTCCINGNIGRNEYYYRKIHRKNAKYVIPTDIKFKNINGKYSSGTVYNDAVIKQRFSTMKEDKEEVFGSKYLQDSYFRQENSALISFDKDDNIYTILTFSYNINYNCIEIDTFWSNLGGGGIMMNFLINAVKCGISLCSNAKKYNNKILVYSTDDKETIKFYKKFNFIDEDDSLTFIRDLSLDSFDSIPNKEVLEESTRINRIENNEETIESTSNILKSNRSISSGKLTRKKKPRRKPKSRRNPKSKKRY